jgi:hypothetical protein
VYTCAAARSLPTTPDDPRATVATIAELVELGWTPWEVRDQIRARRWQRLGRAVLLHNGVPARAELCEVALRNCGPQAILTAFTGAAELGLRGWEREPIHVLVPGGTHVTRVRSLPLRVHFAGDWQTVRRVGQRRVHRAAPALALAAATFTAQRPACGLLAAGVQQRLVTAAQLRDAVANSPRMRHRAALLLAIADIEQGAEALSEIDFARLCRRNGLPEPVRQAVRVRRDGRRRYLDAEWKLAGGRRVVAEVDGALHLAPRKWWADQLRQNEIVLTGDLVLRFPTVVFRHEQAIVIDQLKRALRL